MSKTGMVQRWWLRIGLGGDGIAASIGIGAFSVFVCALAATAWWSLHTHRRAQESARQEQVQLVASLLADSAETLLIEGRRSDLSALRRMVIEAALNHDLSQCRLVLPDGSTIADANPKSPMIKELPTAWAGTIPPSTPAGGRTLSLTITVPGRGEVQLQVVADPGSVLASAWEALAGVGAIGATSLMALLLVLRLMRSRLRALGAIREALAAVERGETDSSALALSASMGPEAGTWNALISERGALREQMLAGRVAESISNRSRGDGDLTGACDALWHGLLLVDANLRIKYANGAAGVFLGHKREDLVGKALKEIADDSAVLDAVGGVITGKRGGKQVIEIKRERAASARPADGAGDRRGAGGQPWTGGVLRLSIRPVRREDPSAAMIVVEDVTQQRVADEARNAFVAQATHELRTPLTNMRLYIEQLQDDSLTDPAERANAINVVNQECRRLERIVGDMLSVAEIEAGSLRLNKGDVRLTQMFEELQRDFDQQARAKELTLRFDLPPKLPVLSGDRDKIMLAVHNLIGNAIKYTPVGGNVNVRAEESKGQFVLEVIDNGIGIREDEHERVFERFYRAKDKRLATITGSGLGLALAREVARLHGGDVTLRSQLDKGSTFALTLPIAPAPAAKAA